MEWNRLASGHIVHLVGLIAFVWKDLMGPPLTALSITWGDRYVLWLLTSGQTIRLFLLKVRSSSPHGDGSGFMKTRGGLSFLRTAQGAAAIDSLSIDRVSALAPNFAHILASDCSEHTRYLNLDTLAPTVCIVVSGFSAPSKPEGIWWKARGYGDQGCKGWAGSVGVECMVRPLKVAVSLLSVHPLPDQCLLHQYTIHTWPSYVLTTGPS